MWSIVQSVLKKFSGPFLTRVPIKFYIAVALALLVMSGLKDEKGVISAVTTFEHIFTAVNHVALPQDPSGSSSSSQTGEQP